MNDEILKFPRLDGYPGHVDAGRDVMHVVGPDRSGISRIPRPYPAWPEEMVCTDEEVGSILLLSGLGRTVLPPAYLSSDQQLYSKTS